MGGGAQARGRGSTGAVLMKCNSSVENGKTRVYPQVFDLSETKKHIRNKAPELHYTVYKYINLRLFNGMGIFVIRYIRGHSLIIKAT